MPKARLPSRFMRGGWRRFGLYIATVASLVAIITIATRGDGGGFNTVVAQLLFIGAIAYLLTFVVWPRRTRLSSQHPAIANGGEVPRPGPRLETPEPDQRPVMRIEPRPPGSHPASEVHARDRLAERPSRGRRPTQRQSTGEMRWPAR